MDQYVEPPTLLLCILSHRRRPEPQDHVGICDLEKLFDAHAG
jgi:hypothetical protein